jgi:hypothetical protein
MGEVIAEWTGLQMGKTSIECKVWYRNRIEYHHWKGRHRLWDDIKMYRIWGSHSDGCKELYLFLLWFLADYPEFYPTRSNIKIYFRYVGVNDVNWTVNRLESDVSIPSVIRWDTCSCGSHVMFASYSDRTFLHSVRSSSWGSVPNGRCIYNFRKLLIASRRIFSTKEKSCILYWASSIQCTFSDLLHLKFSSVVLTCFVARTVPLGMF